DLKPQNVVLGDYGEVIVLDWGLAKVSGQKDEQAAPLDLANSEEGATVAGQVLGTPAYMPPEQAEGRLDLLDIRSDVYGLGAVLYEILTGQPPFFGGDMAQVLPRVVHEPPGPPRAVVPQTPRPLEAACLKAPAKRREDRYGNVVELAEDVKHFLADEPVTAYREPLRMRVGRKLRRYRGLVAAAAVVLISVSAVSSVLALQIYKEKVKAEQAE